LRCEANAIAAFKLVQLRERKRQRGLCELKRESLIWKSVIRDGRVKKKEENVARSGTCAPLADVSRPSKLFPTSVHTCDFYKVPTGREHTVVTLKPLPPPSRLPGLFPAARKSRDFSFPPSRKRGRRGNGGEGCDERRGS